MKCTQCKVNFAVVFVTKLIDGKQVQEGLCLSCAKKQGIKPINQLIEQTGMTEEDIDNLNKQVGGMFESLDMDQLGDTLSLADGAKNPENIPDFTNHNNEGGNPLFSLFNKVMPGHNNNDNNKNDGKNYTRTKTKERRVPKKRKFLGLYGINLTERADLGKIDRVIGRYREIDRVIQILNRRTKNNPVLVGEPGVGKTAIAEGLAVRITTGQVPAKLLTSEVYLLDLAAVVAGTQFRGQFESRMKGILEEVIQNKNIILVIDELHNIMGAGEADGAMNAGNILKPYLARGDIQVIGATTMKEYRKHIEKDSALERRFQPVIIDEPSVSDTIEILKGIKDYYEDYHRVSISEDVLKKAVMLSERYITDRFLPDKAIDVIDEAGSRANLMNEGLVELEALKNELAMVNEEKEQAVSADSIEEYQKAADYKVRECKLREQIAEIEAKTKIVDITEEDIAHVIESWTKNPCSKNNGNRSREAFEA
jgi:ATP-dependent Clp protease ATP-binding subunit ClpC